MGRSCRGPRPTLPSSCAAAGRDTTTPRMTQNSDVRLMWVFLNAAPAIISSSAFRNPPDAAVQSCARSVTQAQDRQLRLPTPCSCVPSGAASICTEHSSRDEPLPAGHQTPGPFALILLVLEGADGALGRAEALEEFEVPGVVAPNRVNVAHEGARLTFVLSRDGLCELPSKPEDEGRDNEGLARMASRRVFAQRRGAHFVPHELGLLLPCPRVLVPGWGLDSLCQRMAQSI